MDKYIPKIKIVNIVNNQLFCLCDDCNCILIIDLNNFRVRYAGKLESEYSFQLALSCRSIVYKNNIFYSPYYSRNIHFFDTSKRKDGIITCPYEIDLTKDKYYTLLQDGARCYIIPFVGEKILEIDMDKKRATRTIDIYNILKRKGIPVDKNNFSQSDGYRYKDKFYIAMENMPFIVELDLKNDNYEAFRIEGLDNGLCGLAGIDNKLYIYNKNHCIITYDIDKKKIIKEVKVLEKVPFFFYTTIVSNNDIYFLRGRYSIAVRYNVVTCEIECINFNNRLRNAKSGEDYKFIGAIEEGRILLIADRMSMLIVDFKNNRYEHVQLHYNTEELKNSIIQNAYFQSENIEYSELALPCYIQYEKNDNANEKESNVGSKIYSVIQRS